MTTRVRKEGGDIIESHFSREQAKDATERQKIAGHLVNEKTLERDGRFEIKYRREEDIRHSSVAERRR